MTVRPSSPSPISPPVASPAAGPQQARSVTREGAQSPTETVNISPAALAALAPNRSDEFGPERFKSLMTLLTPEGQSDPVALRDAAYRMAKALNDDLADMNGPS